MKTTPNDSHGGKPRSKPMASRFDLRKIVAWFFAWFKPGQPKRGRFETPAVTCSLRETAEMVGVHPATLYRLVARKLITPVPGLRHLRFTHEEIHRFLTGGNHGR